MSFPGYSLTCCHDSVLGELSLSCVTPQQDSQNSSTSFLWTFAPCTPFQEKGPVTPQETDPDLPRSVQESPAEAGVGAGLLQGWGQ